MVPAQAGAQPHQVVAFPHAPAPSARHAPAPRTHRRPTPPQRPDAHGAARRRVACAAHPWLLEAAIRPHAVLAQAEALIAFAWLAAWLTQRQLRRSADARLRLWDAARIMHTWPTACYAEHLGFDTASRDEMDAAMSLDPDKLPSGLLLALGSNTARHWRALALGSALCSHELLEGRLQPGLALWLLQLGSDAAEEPPLGPWQPPLADLLVSPELLECCYAAWLAELLTPGPRFVIERTRRGLRALSQWERGLEETGEPL